MRTLDAVENDLLWRHCQNAATQFSPHTTGHKLNFRCNICGDGKHGHKRGYLVFDTSRQIVYYKCFNEGDCPCAGDGNAWHGTKWLRKTNPREYEEYKKELRRYRYGSKPKKPKDELQAISSLSYSQPQMNEVEKEFMSFAAPEDCSAYHKLFLNDFIVRRKIPADRARQFRFCEEGKYRDRIAIPTYDESGHVVFFQCRAIFDDQEPKYLSSSVERTNILYGVERIDRKKPVIVLEGPIDSMFVENAVATMGCSYSEEVQTLLDGMDSWYMFDNDTAGNSKARTLLARGKHVFLWSKFLERNRAAGCKDVNDFILRSGKNMLTFKELEPFFTNSPFAVARLLK